MYSSRAEPAIPITFDYDPEENTLFEKTEGSIDFQEYLDLLNTMEAMVFRTLAEGRAWLRLPPE